MRTSRGSAIVDYILPTAIIGLILGLGLFKMYESNMLAKFWAASSNAGLNIQDGMAIINPLGGGSSGISLLQKSISGVNVTFNPDNSASFTYNGQNINFSSTDMSNLNEIAETSGSTGLTTEIIEAVKKLIDDHSAEYSPSSVPVQIAYGTSNRMVKSYPDEYDINYNGDASYNAVQFSVGDHLIIVGKDQSVEHQVDGWTDIPSNQGNFKIEGNISGSGFTGTTYGNNGTSGNTYSATVSGQNLTGFYSVPDSNYWNFSIDTTPANI